MIPKGVRSFRPSSLLSVFTRFFVLRYTRLEHELQAELNDPRVAEAGSFERCTPKLPLLRFLFGMSKLTWLKTLKNSARNCTFMSVLHAEVLEQPHVPALQVRSVVGAPPDGAEGADVIHGESRRIERDRLRRTRRGLDGLTRQLRAIVADAVTRVVRAASTVYGRPVWNCMTPVHCQPPITCFSGPARLPPGRSSTHDVVKR